MLLLFINILLQLLAMPGMIILTGLFVMTGKRIFYKITGRRARFVEYVTGIIGTPIHELSHALMCILFRHKIKEMKLFQLDPKSNTLGYVTHTYNKKNLYQSIGNFFIGIAPLIFGSFTIGLLMSLFQKEMFEELLAVISNTEFTVAGVAQSVRSMGNLLLTPRLSNYLWWIYVVLAFMVVIHMELSKDDIKGSTQGLFLYILLLAVINSLMFFAGATDAQSLMSQYMLITMCALMTISLAYIVLWILIAFVLMILLAPFKKRKRV